MRLALFILFLPFLASAQKAAPACSFQTRAEMDAFVPDIPDGQCRTAVVDAAGADQGAYEWNVAANGWVKMQTGPDRDGIYSGSGPLVENTTVTMGANDLLYDGTEDVIIDESFGLSSLGNINFDKELFLGGDLWSTNRGSNTNAYLGYLSGHSNSGSSNTAIGHLALGNRTSSNSTALGYRAGLRNEGNGIFIGPNAGADNQGTNNIFIGNFAGSTSSDKNNRIAIGTGALQNSDFARNVAIGHEAGMNANAEGQTFIGTESGSNSTGERSTFVGQYSGTNSTGIQNTGIGAQSLERALTGQENSFLGISSGEWLASSYNVGVGKYACRGCDQDYNTAIGYRSKNYSLGELNTAIGAFSQQQHSGSENTSIGAYSGYLADKNGVTYNAAALSSQDITVTGHGFTGRVMLYCNSSTITNIPAGSSSLYEVVDPNTLRKIQTGPNLGTTGTAVLEGMIDVTNSTAVGYNAQFKGDNHVQLGNDDVNQASIGAYLIDLSVAPTLMQAIAYDGTKFLPQTIAGGVADGNDFISNVTNTNNNLTFTGSGGAANLTLGLNNIDAAQLGGQLPAFYENPSWLESNQITTDWNLATDQKFNLVKSTLNAPTASNWFGLYIPSTASGYGFNIAASGADGFRLREQAASAYGAWQTIVTDDNIDNYGKWQTSGTGIKNTTDGHVGINVASDLDYSVKLQQFPAVNAATKMALRASYGNSGINKAIGAIDFIGRDNDTGDQIAAQIETLSPNGWTGPGDSNGQINIKTLDAGALSTKLTINSDGTIQLPSYGAGLMQLDASGNITSDFVLDGALDMNTFGMGNLSSLSFSGATWQNVYLKTDVAGQVQAQTGIPQSEITGAPWTVAGTNVSLTTLTNNVGIGTATPTESLHVNGEKILLTGDGTSTAFNGSMNLYAQDDINTTAGSIRGAVVEVTSAGPLVLRTSGGVEVESLPNAKSIRSDADGLLSAFNPTVTIVTTNTTYGEENIGIVADAVGGAVTITINPSLLVVGQIYTFKSINNGTNVVSLTTSSGDIYLDATPAALPLVFGAGAGDGGGLHFMTTGVDVYITARN